MEDFVSTMQAAKLLGISRVAVLKKIKKGQLEAEKIGRNYIIPKASLKYILSGEVSNKEKKELDKAIKKVVKEYGEALKLLGNE